MKRKLLVMLLAGTLALSGIAGCQSSGDSGSDSKTTGEGQKTKENDEEASKEKEEEAEAEVNEYGFTEAQQEALLASVKESVTTEYLEKYGIDPSGFQLSPFDPNDTGNYEYIPNENGYETVYSGSDPYECSYAWQTANTVISHANNMYLGGSDPDMIEMSLKQGFAETMQEQNEKNDKPYVWTTFEQRDVLADALYRGIVQFLSEMDVEEGAELVARLVKKADEAGTTQVGDYEVSNATLFDRVISENIEF